MQEGRGNLQKRIVKSTQVAGLNQTWCGPTRQRRVKRARGSESQGNHRRSQHTSGQLDNWKVCTPEPTLAKNLFYHLHLLHLRQNPSLSLQLNRSYLFLPTLAGQQAPVTSPVSASSLPAPGSQEPVATLNFFVSIRDSNSGLHANNFT